MRSPPTSTRGASAREAHFRLRDWGVSRQRYWGCPIPIIYCASCGDVPVPEEQLPVVLPEDVGRRFRRPRRSRPTPNGATAPARSAAARPSARPTPSTPSWSRAGTTRATPAPVRDEHVDARANYWLPVDQYIGGIEHAILHLLYFRFYHKLMRDEGLVQSDEPATNLLCQGMVIAETFYREAPTARRTGSTRPTSRSSATACAYRWQVRRPAGGHRRHREDVEVEEQRRRPADAWSTSTAPTRCACSRCSPRRRSSRWNGSEAGVEGMARFLRRFWREITTQHVAAGSSGGRPAASWTPGRRRCAASCTRPSRRSATISAAATPSTPRSPR